MNITNTTKIIEAIIEKYLDNGYTNKQDIYSKVVEETGIPRPTVRRIARELRNKYLERVRILQSELTELNETRRYSS